MVVTNARLAVAQRAVETQSGATLVATRNSWKQHLLDTIGAQKMPVRARQSIVRNCPFLTIRKIHVAYRTLLLSVHALVNGSRLILLRFGSGTVFLVLEHWFASAVDALVTPGFLSHLQTQTFEQVKCLSK